MFDRNKAITETREKIAKADGYSCDGHPFVSVNEQVEGILRAFARQVENHVTEQVREEIRRVIEEIL